MSSPTLDVAALEALVGHRITVSGQSVGQVTPDGVDDLGDAVSLRIRTADGNLHEAVLDLEELSSGIVEPAGDRARLVDGGELFDLVESRRIELACAHDPNFAVSLSGVRGLPHQIVAVYKHMLPQPRLRLVLADDPGAGKTIMAGSLLKELRLRMVGDRVLVLCPAPLTVQWQDELGHRRNLQAVNARLQPGH
jgi:SNF2 family DNA or RNA helicase